MVLVNEVMPVESDDTPDDGHLMWDDRFVCIQKYINVCILKLLIFTQLLK